MRRLLSAVFASLLVAGTAHAAASPQETVYRVYQAALQKGDIDALEATMTQARAAEFEKQRNSLEFKLMFGFIRDSALRDSKVEKVEVNGNDATLSANGKDSSGNASTESVHMLNESGQWRIEKVSTSTQAH
ncbi:MAG: hypothetical protein ACREPT_07785 [Rudaea sp.]